jgi:hypothetical protein
VRRTYYAEMEALVKAESGASRVVVFGYPLDELVTVHAKSSSHTLTAITSRAGLSGPLLRVRGFECGCDEVSRL